IPSVEHCVTHLQVLDLFVDLRGRVEGWGASSGAVADVVWQDFVKFAVARFTHWFRTARRPVVEMEASVPPLDVLMVWHSFMLNPHSYHAFCKSARGDGAGLLGISWLQLVMSLSPCIWHPTLLDTYDELSTTGFAYRTYNIDLDLAGAVQRQGSFALKMVRFGWHHSPSCKPTLQRARERYGRFFSLIPTLPIGVSAVPTLDIDLVWHTHQLSPAGYTEYSRAVANGRLINHDDTITQEDANSDSKNTGIMYRESFGDVY
ncbi:hypothetical protein N658DRAFT_400638, partial [Parathielavia hyrcaniae]